VSDVCAETASFVANQQRDCEFWLGCIGKYALGKKSPIFDIENGKNCQNGDMV